MKFEKWQALGNDYLILEADEPPLGAEREAGRVALRPAFRVGADGVLLLSRSEDPEFVAELRIFNPDGSEAELSGNGAREAILYLRRHGWTDEDELRDHAPSPGRSADDHRRADLLGRHGQGLDHLQGLPLRRRGRHGAR